MTRKKQARGIKTRQSIVDAALKVIGQVGAARLNHRSLAKEAGVSLARTTYHFASQDEIISAALQRLAEIDSLRFAEAVRETGIEAATREYFLKDALATLNDDLDIHREHTVIYLELGLEAARNAEAGKCFSTLYEHRLSYFSSLFRCANYPDPEESACIFLRCYIGLLLQEISISDSIADVRQLENRLSGYLDLAESIN